jgi:ABC-type amino acid transport substrate-binding protein
MSRWRHKRWLLAAGNIVLVGGLLSGLSFLPPDNSLAEVRQMGVLKLCVPESAPPFALNDPKAPGFDVELVRLVAEEIGARATVNVVASIGKDFNPRNWRVTRGQCSIIAGGVADTVQTRNFLQTIATQTETGWVGISRDELLPDKGSAWAVWPGASGLDRLSLSVWLRKRGASARLVRSPEELLALLDEGKINGAIMERYEAASVDTSRGYRVFWLPQESFERYRMALGLWKGDQTLYRAVKAAIQKMEKSDNMKTIRFRYGLGRPVGLPR